MPPGPDADSAPADSAPSDGDHYFSAEPASAAERRTLDVHLAGRDLTVQTASGIFSPGRVDLGTQVLLRSVPAPPPAGNLLDLGCGWGPIAVTLALLAPGATVWAVDVNTRALDLLRHTIRDLGLENVVAVGPDDVPDDVLFAAVWSNPPIRVGKEVLHGMLGRWLRRLTPEGQAHLVVQRNLGADSLQRWIVTELGLPTERVASAKGFRVLRVSPA
ncbi:class I SAM-dependent methyltransferase [Cellulomonas sp. KRMCY2]|uniref:class I SAM-dependent methyltransferase n=1 Tax=Cellulomonas sp. KRMCY2 TaxID=1304865 RepID=UPI0006882ACA|nr:methyltransferase [Cellulomonas sp. KRMCY2]